MKKLLIAAAVSFAVLVRAEEPTDVDAVAKAKAKFNLLAYVCATTPKLCNVVLEGKPSMWQELGDAETAFMEACRVCAPVQACEADRVTIVSGKGSSNYNPCDTGPVKPAKAVKKKPAP